MTGRHAENRWRRRFRVAAVSALAFVCLIALGGMNRCGTPDQEEPVRVAKRVYLLGWDGADWDVIDELFRRDELPNLRWLIERGVRADLRTDVGFSPVSWTTLATGMEAKHHGVPHDANLRESWTGSARMVRSAQLWDMLPAESYRRISVVNYYFPPERDRNPERFDVLHPKGRPDAICPDARRGAVTTRNCPLARVLDERKADAVFSIAQDTDTLGHSYFGCFTYVLSSGCMADDPDECMPALFGCSEILADSYRYLDDLLGLAIDDEDALIVVASDHGFYPLNPLRFDLSFSEDFYVLLGTQPQYPPLRSEKPYEFEAHSPGGPIRIRLEPRMQIRKYKPMDQWDRRLTVQFGIPEIVCVDCTEQEAGFVAAAVERLRLLDVPLYEARASADGMRFVPWANVSDAINGAVCQAVEKGDGDLDRTEYGPYLVVDFLTGNHGPQDVGVLVLAGPGVRRGAMIGKADLVDVAPTILALLDLPVAKDFDGIVLKEAIDPAFLREHPVRRIASYGVGHPVGEVANEPMEPEMKRKLQELGYID